MALMLIALHRRPDLTHEGFIAYWLETHAPLVRELASTLGITGYAQIHPDPDATLWDGLAQVRFESRGTLESALTTAPGRAAARRLRADERNFTDLDRSATWWGSEHLVL
jgi:uncharacterized protein (TIGR02118 family)